MKLLLADYHLEACRLCLAEGEGRRGKGEKRGAKEHLAIAKEMIEKMGYGRRKSEVEIAKKA